MIAVRGKDFGTKAIGRVWKNKKGERVPNKGGKGSKAQVWRTEINRGSPKKISFKKKQRGRKRRGENWGKRWRHRLRKKAPPPPKRVKQRRAEPGGMGEKKTSGRDQNRRKSVCGNERKPALEGGGRKGGKNTGGRIRDKKSSGEWEKTASLSKGQSKWGVAGSKGEEKCQRSEKPHHPQLPFWARVKKNHGREKKKTKGKSGGYCPNTKIVQNVGKSEYKTRGTAAVPRRTRVDRNREKPRRSGGRKIVRGP